MSSAGSCVEPFGDTHHGAARTRVARDLCLVGERRPTDELQARPRRRRDLREPGPGRVLAAAGSHEALDDAVLERVEADHDETSARLQCDDGLRKRALDLAELIVQVDAQRLESARRRMAARLATG